ncbi:MAG: glycosyltransferase family 39 protein, partial [Acidimicrobiales bacterium]
MTAKDLPRHHVVVLVLLTVFALARGGYWAMAFETWSPVDEAQHFGYVESLATGDGIPTVGRDHLSNHVMVIAKASPTYFARSRPFLARASDNNWGPAREQYEGIHGPTYYALMVPAYWLGGALSPLGALYAVRLASVLLGAAAIPLAWALARRLLPDRPLAWLLGPGLLVCVNGYMATAATVSNDTLVITGTVAALLLTTRALASPRWLPAAIAGAVAGAVFVGKTTALGLFPLMALLAIVQHRNGLASTEGWLRRLVAAGTGAAIITLPWIAWNLVTYQAISGAAAVEAITGSLQTVLEPSLHALHRHWEGARVTFWEAGLLTGDASYRRAWDLLAAGVGALGLVAALRRWRRPEVLTVG